LVEAGEAVQVRAVEVGEAAVAEADVGRYQRKARFGVLRQTVAVDVDERPGVDVRVPLVNRNLSQILDHAIAGQCDGRRNTVDDLVVPLVEEGNFPIPRWNTGKVEVPTLVALDEREVRTVRISQAGIALGEGKAVARAA